MSVLPSIKLDRLVPNLLLDFQQNFESSFVAAGLSAGIATQTLVSLVADSSKVS